jgi:hypothetical protein
MIKTFMFYFFFYFFFFIYKCLYALIHVLLLISLFVFCLGQCPFVGKSNVDTPDDHKHGKVHMFSCPSIKAKLTGTPMMICLDGKWSNSVPTCERKQTICTLHCQAPNLI